LKKEKKISGFVFWGSWGVLYPKMVEKFEKKFLGTWWVNMNQMMVSLQGHQTHISTNPPG
jgi:LDH2 family malate/lactate/ureidoglycolate dehydrogenase